MLSKNTSQPTAGSTSSVYCYICTHTVEAIVARGKRGVHVKPGQRCSRCAGALDAGYVFQQAA